VISTLKDLTHADLVRILQEPKDALVKQYQKLFDLDGVKLKFTESALNAIADLSLERKSGARGLRAIMENTLLDIMYELPSQNDVMECIISEEVVKQGDKPILLLEKKSETA
jgi:ATP-dependent Clp protease ATP-binding subunit ClpX